MEKKTIVILLVSCIMLCGCTDKNISQYDKSTNQQIEFYGLSFQVPYFWERSFSNEEYICFMECDEQEEIITVFSITTESEEDSLEEYAKSTEDNLVATQKEMGVFDIKTYEESINDIPCQVLYFKRKWSGHTYENKIVIFQQDESIVCMDISTKSNMGIQDFDKIIDSISLVLND